MDGDKTYAGREIVANDIIPIPRSITFSKAGYKKNKQKNRWLQHTHAMSHILLYYKYFSGLL